jgi:hypothetical protein
VTPRRILLLLDESNDPEAGLTAALRVEVDAPECVALFVANEDLLRLARLPGLPTVPAVTPGASGAPAPPVPAPAQPGSAPGDAMAHWSAQRQAAQRDRLTLLQRRFDLRLEWQVRRRGPGLLSDAGPRDLLVVAQPAAASWVGSDWPRLLRNAASDVLFVNPPWTSGRCVIVLDDGSVNAADAVAQARRIAASEGLPVTRLQTGASAAAPAAAPAAAAVSEEVVVPTAVDAEALLARCAGADARLLVLPADLSIDWSTLLDSMLELLDCSLLVCRGA